MEGPCKKFPSGWACFYKKMNGNNNMSKGIKIDDKHTYMVGKFGPVIRCTATATSSRQPPVNSDDASLASVRMILY